MPPRCASSVEPKLRVPKFAGLVALLLVAATVALGSCSKNSDTGTVDTTGASTCEPGENIFCRCPGGAAGTKECKADGKTYEPCVTRAGSCSETNPLGSSSHASSSHAV